MDGVPSQEYPDNAGVPQDSILGPTLSYYTLMIFLMMLSVILLSVLMILLSNLSVIRHLIWGNNKNWLLNLDWDWDRRWLIDFNAGKTQLLSIDWSNNADAIDVKMDGSVLEE